MYRGAAFQASGSSCLSGFVFQGWPKASLFKLLGYSLFVLVQSSCF